MEDNNSIYNVFRIEKEHKLKKKEIGDRLHVARVYVRRHYRHARGADENDFLRQCEAVLDNLLVKYKYDVEYICDQFRKIVPKIGDNPMICKICEYRPPFCTCDR